MAIGIPANFNNDIQSNHTSIVPLIVIRTYGQDNAIYLSTNSGNILTGLGVNFKPLLLNVPSLKESIDLETRKYKISSVTLDCSNVEYQGTRLSDEIYEKFGSLMNTEIRIFWSSPSTTDLGFFDIVPYDPADPNQYFRAFQVYTGTVRRYSHTDEKVKIELEDRSQAYLHKDLPLPENYLGTGKDIPDKYKNKPITMVYGYVDKSPLLQKYSESSVDDDLLGQIKGIPDIQLVQEIDTDNCEYLSPAIYVFNNDGYNHVLQDQEKILIKDEDGFSTHNIPKQYYISNNIITLPSIYNFDFTLNDDMDDIDAALENTNVKNLISSRLIQCYRENLISHWLVNQISDGGIGYGITSEEFTVGGVSGKPSGINNNFTFGYIGGNGGEQGVISANINISDLANIDFQTGILKIIFPEIKDFDSSSKIASALTGELGASFESGGASYQVQINFYDKTGLRDNLVLAGSSSGGVFTTPEIITTADTSFNNIYDFPNNEYTFKLALTSIQGATNATFKLSSLDGNELKHKYWYNISFNDKIFYGNIAGRLSSGVGVSPTAPSVISNIIQNELNVDTGNIATLPTEYSDMQYAFTVHKKINSKKLIESIASASPFIPHFNNQGSFKFNTIPSSNPSSDHIIQESKIIDFTYKRTKIEDVKTKVELKYKIDYARDEFGKSVIKQENNADYFDYYGFIDNNGDAITDHSLSTLAVDDDRGKYIRDDLTADKFCQWLLDYHKNQHLIMTVKLPLSVGLSIEVGDIVEFDKLLGDVKPYGIDYKNNFILNNQKLFPNFIVTSTNKTLDMVTIECEQLHELLINFLTPQWTTLYGESSDVFQGAAINTPTNFAYGNITDTADGWQDRLKAEIPSIKYIGEFKFTGLAGATPIFQLTGNTQYYNYEDDSGSLGGILGFFEGGAISNPADVWVYGIILEGDSEVTTNYFSGNMNVFGEPI